MRRRYIIITWGNSIELGRVLALRYSSLKIYICFLKNGFILAIHLGPKANDWRYLIEIHMATEENFWSIKAQT